MARNMSLPVRILDEDRSSGRNASQLSVARFELYFAVQPYGEEPSRRCMKAGFAHPGGDPYKTDT